MAKLHDNQTPSIINLSKVYKIYTLGELRFEVLKNINIKIDTGESVAIMGPSGSGKSTLMNIIGLLDRPTRGTFRLDDEEIDLSMSDYTLASLRSQKVGFVFQSFNLLPRLSALDNVLLPTAYNRVHRVGRLARAHSILEQVGLGERLHHKPSQLSGGEKQRVAIARALINDPEVVLADEPTGNLDSRSGHEVINILHKLNRDGKTVIIVTHDEKIAKTCKRIIHLLDGEVTNDSAD